MDKLVKIYDKAVTAFAALSALFICIMMMTTVADIIMRKILKQTFIGGMEIIQMSLVCVVYFAVGYTTFKRGQITVDVVKVPFIVVFICNIASVVTGVMFIISLIQQAEVSRGNKGATLNLDIPYWPFMYIAAFGFVMMIFSLIFLILQDARNKRRGVDIGSFVESDDVSSLDGGARKK
jgi:TRAP-type C4-dicarboxylate transport system permease small subunit